MPSFTFKNPIGLDISDLKLRFFQLDQKKSKKILVKAVGEIAVPPGIIVDGEIKNESEVVNLIKKLFSQPLLGKISNKFINASLPEKKIFTKVISIPNVPEEEMFGTVKWGIEQNIPVVMDQVYFDWCKVNNKKPTTNKTEVVVGVAPQSIVDTYTSVIEKTGYTLISLENESVAIARCLIDQQADVYDPLLILDLGKSRTNITTYANNTVQFTTTIDINGMEMTNMIASNLKLSFEDAEKAKIICGLDKMKGRGAICKILEPVMNRLVEKINESLIYFNEYLMPNQNIKTIILTGSVAQMVMLPVFLQEKLKMTVIIGDPWSNITNANRNPAKLQGHSLYSFTTAIGLALKQL
jgi:type IV pilus assembly protein PilM